MKGVAGENLLELLERRFDNTVYRLGMATSRNESRQLVCHGHFTLNGRRLDIPSASVKQGDVIGLTARGAKAARIEGALDAVDAHAVPAWLTLDKTAKTGEVVGRPSREELTIPMQEQLIIELYASR
jgi:small subunit ribosomal protein S4